MKSIRSKLQRATFAALCAIAMSHTWTALADETPSGNTPTDTKTPMAPVEAPFAIQRDLFLKLNNAASADKPLCFGAGSEFRKIPPDNKKYSIEAIRACANVDKEENAAEKGPALRAKLIEFDAESETLLTAYRSQVVTPGIPSQQSASLAAGGSKARRYDLQQNIWITVSGKNGSGGDQTGLVCIGEGSDLVKMANGMFSIETFKKCGSDTNAKSAWISNSAVTIPSADDRLLVESVSSEIGLNWGMLLVPYKFQLSGDRELKGGSTIGAYLGAEWGLNTFGVKLNPLIFAGAGNTSVKQNVNGSDVDNNLFALSYGAGVNVQIDSTFNMGFAVGFDHVDNKAGYQYNDSPWIALQIGADFTQ